MKSKRSINTQNFKNKPPYPPMSSSLISSRLSDDSESDNDNAEDEDGTLDRGNYDGNFRDHDNAEEPPAESFSVRNIRFRGAGIGFILAFIITGIVCFLTPPGNAIITAGLIASWGGAGGIIGAMMGAIIDNCSFACLSTPEIDNLDQTEFLDYEERVGRYSIVGSINALWTKLKTSMQNIIRRTPASPAAAPVSLNRRPAAIIIAAAIAPPPADPAVIVAPPAPTTSWITSLCSLFQRAPAQAVTNPQPNAQPQRSPSRA